MTRPPGSTGVAGSEPAKEMMATSAEKQRTRVTRHGRVALLEMDSPETLNALDLPMQAELGRFADYLAANAAAAPVAVIASSSPRAFCAGGDVKAMDRGDVGEAYLRGLNRLILKLADLDTVLVAAVNGAAFGGGFCLALACDLVVAAEDAVFSMAHTRVGLVPDMGAHYFLPRAVGLTRAREILLSAARIPAAQAQAYGLINRVVPPDQLLPAALDFAQELAAGPAVALRLSKRILQRSLDRPLEQVLEDEVRAQEVCFGTADHREGVRAVLEKRKPAFGGG